MFLRFYYISVSGGISSDVVERMALPQSIGLFLVLMRCMYAVLLDPRYISISGGISFEVVEQMALPKSIALFLVLLRCMYAVLLAQLARVRHQQSHEQLLHCGRASQNEAKSRWRPCDEAFRIWEKVVG